MEPNWTPLEIKVGPDRRVGFMHMGKASGIYVRLHLP